MLDHSDTKLVFVTEFQRQRLVEALDQVTRNIEVVVIDKDAKEIFPETDVPAYAFPDVTIEEPALLLYTSGTTGLPKGCVLTQQEHDRRRRKVTLAHQAGRNDIGLVSLPLYHINAEIVSVMAPLVSGSSVVMPERFHASEFWPLISDYRCSWSPSCLPSFLTWLPAPK